MPEQYAVSSSGCQVCFCRKCGVVLNEETWRASLERAKDKICIACHRAYKAEYRDKNRERVAESMRKWVEGNRERHLEYMRDYRRRNKDKLRKLNAEWVRKNPERIKAFRIEYYAANKAEILARVAQWGRDNKDKCLVNARNRRARVRGAEGSHTAQDIRDIYAEQGGKCAACGADLSTGYHVDHIQAIINGGSNDRGNLQILCPHCNLSKGSKDYEEFLLYLELRTQSLVESA